MPFGKFRGVQICDLDDHYLSWLRDINLREPLRSAVNAEFERRSAKPDPITTIPSAVRLMGLELISAGFRKLALEHHPDHGGDHSTMVLINNAANFLRQTLRNTTSPGGPA